MEGEEVVVVAGLSVVGERNEKFCQLFGEKFSGTAFVVLSAGFEQYYTGSGSFLFFIMEVCSLLVLDLADDEKR